MTNAESVISEDQLPDRDQADRPELIRFMSAFVEGNIMYILSALFLLLGATMMRHSEALAVSEFGRTLQSLMVLQGYELCLILTSIVIVRHFGKINDAFILFAIFFVLVLDPTSFSNAFHTMLPHYDSYGMSLYMNVILLFAALVKFAVITHAIRYQVSLRGWFAFTFMAACLYLSEFLLVWLSFDSVPMYYTWVLAWLPFMMTLVLPTDLSFGSFREGDDFASKVIRNRVDFFLLALPSLAIAIHYIQSGIMHEYPLTPMQIAPLLLAVPATVFLFHRKLSSTGGILISADIALVLAVLFSWPGQGKGVPGEWQSVQNAVVLMMLGAAGILFYIRFYLHTRNAAVFRRFYVMAGGVVLYGLYLTGVFGYVHILFLTILDFVLSHRALMMTLLFTILLVESLLNLRHWMASSAWVFFTLLCLDGILRSAGIDAWQGSLFLMALCIMVIAITRHASLKELRIVLIISLSVLLMAHLESPGQETLLYFLVLTGFGIYLVWRNRDWVSGMITVFFPVILIGRLELELLSSVPIALYVVMLGLMTFICGVFVTFRKDSIRNRIGAFEASFEQPATITYSSPEVSRTYDDPEKRMDRIFGDTNDPRI